MASMGAFDVGSILKHPDVSVVVVEPCFATETTTPLIGLPVSASRIHPLRSSGPNATGAEADSIACAGDSSLARNAGSMISRKIPARVEMMVKSERNQRKG